MLSSQTWTQGESVESKYWFPCIESLQIKFSTQIEIIVHKKFTVISNGLLKSKSEIKNNLIIWRFEEENPISSYLVSIVIGMFSLLQSKYLDIPLYHYFPKYIKKEDAFLTFSETPKMLKFFEKYLVTKFPYQKYSQTAISDFDLGGMENAGCTTLTDKVFHDKKLSFEYQNDIFFGLS